MTGCSGPINQQSKMGNLLSLTGTLYLIGTSRKDEGKALKKSILKDLEVHGFDAGIEEI